MSDVARSLEERADAYLDGDLSREDALVFERDLALRPEVAEALAAALSLRELLVALPPVAPPAGLADRITRSLPLGRSRRGAARPAEAEGSPLRAVLAGLAWTFRGTTVAAMGSAAPAVSASAGLGQVRWVLGPLGAPALPAPRPPPPLWRRVLFGRRRP